MNRAIISVCWAVLIGTAAALAWLFWSLLWPFHLLESHAGAWDITNNDKVAHYGETVLVNWRGCRYTDLPARIDTELRGAILISLPTRVATTAPGCMEVGYPIVYVGPEIPAGKYKARVIISFDVNPVRTVQYIYETDEFRIEAQSR